MISIPYKERSSTIELLCSANNQTVVARSLTVPYRLRYLSYFIFCSIAVISCALAIQPILRRTCARGMSYQFLRLRTKWGRSDIRIRIYVCVKSCAAAASCCQAVAKKMRRPLFVSSHPPYVGVNIKNFASCSLQV